jgi:hypothetical protein
MNYKSLPTAEKLAEIADCNFCGEEIRLAEEYSLALSNDNRTIIEDYENFGASPRQIIMNKVSYVRAVSVFGFMEKRFNEHGWLEHGNFMDCEEFAFNTKRLLMGRNSVSIGRSPNNKWAYGVNLAVSDTGYCSDLSVFNKPYTSRGECLKAGLERFTEWHQKANDHKAASIFREAKDILDVLTGRKAVQLSLF